MPFEPPDASRGLVSRTLMYAIGLVLLFPVPLLLSVEWDGANARPERAEERRPNAPLQRRHQRILEAAARLQQQLARLEGLLAGGRFTERRDRDAALSEWQDEMERIKAEYRIWGVVDVQHPDATAEDALRNALLYLHSLKHLAMNDPNWQTSAEFSRLRGDFESSLATAVR